MKAVVTNDYSIAWRLFRFITGRGFGLGTRISEVRIAEPKENELLVKVTAVALNPSDNLHADLVGNPGSILGCDYCGEIVRSGAPSQSSWAVGQKVAGVVHGGMRKDQGCFAEYVLVPQDLVWCPPSSITDEQAATFGISAVTAMLGLYTELNLPWPDETPISSPSSIFVYAGSAGASLFVIQLAKLSNLTVVTTCSPHNFDLVKSYGADFVYDYRAEGVVDTIRAAHPTIDKAFDGLSTTASTTFCAEVVKDNSGKVVVLLDSVKAARQLGVDAKFIMLYTVFGESFSWLPPVGPSFPAQPAARQALVRFYRLLPSLMTVLKPLPTKSLAPGLDQIPENMMIMKKGVSGTKLTASL